jgi:protein-disulfide isomerase
VTCRTRLIPASLVTLLAFGTLLLAAPSAQKSQTATKKATPAKATDSAPTVSIATISVDGVNDIDPTKAFGSKSAPVVVEIFSDFQCPACRALFLNTTQKVMDNYVNTGKIYLVHRDFPLPMHAYSRVAASYARAAAHIGKCEPVEMALFQNQDKWEASGDVKGTVASVLSPAEMKKVEAIVESKQLEPLIEKDKAIGQTFPVSQTPTTVFHANGQTYPYAGTLNYDVLKDFLDQLVKQK